jgi:hypothetical protein
MKFWIVTTFLILGMAVIVFRPKPEEDEIDWMQI